MTNSDMKPGRFLNAMNSKRTVAKIQDHLTAGGEVIISTYTKATRYKKKHVEMFRASKRENGFYAQNGRCWLYNPLGSVAIRFH